MGIVPDERGCAKGGAGPIGHTPGMEGEVATDEQSVLDDAIRTTTRPSAFGRLLKDAWKEYQRDHARYFATAMVYYALVSLMPLALLVLAAVGLLLRFGDFALPSESQLLATIEIKFGPDVSRSVEALLEQLQAESVIATPLSLVWLMWAASSLFRHLRLGFRAIWKHAPPLMSGAVREAVRATFAEYVAAYSIVLIGGVVLVLAFVVVSVTQWLGELVVRLPLLERTPAWVLALPGSLLIVGLTFAFLFRFLPPVRVPLRHVWLAAGLCTAAWLVGTESMVVLGAAFDRVPTASSAFGGLLVAMLWLNVVSQLLFYGGELCKVLSMREAAAHIPARSV